MFRSDCRHPGDTARLAALEREIDGSHGYGVDVTDAARVKEVLERVHAEMGAVSVLVHNAVSGRFGEFLDVEPAVLEQTFRTNVLSLLLFGQVVVPHMLARGGGAIVVTGNTSAWRGAANFAAFAPSKAAQRILAQSMADELFARPDAIAVLLSPAHAIA